MSTLRLGVVGTGHWARTVHAAGAAAHPGADLVAVWGRDRAKAQAVAAEAGAAAYDDFEAFLDGVEVVSFAVAPHIQADLALRAATAGKHLLLDKPVALDVAAADRLVDATHGLRTLVFFTGRFAPAWEHWLQGLDPATLHSGRVEWLSSAAPGSPYEGSLWRREHGALWDVGPHALSFLLPALGPVGAIRGRRGRGDHVELVLSHEGGATSSMKLSLTMPAPGSSRLVEFWGPGGRQVCPSSDIDSAAAYPQALTELLADIEGRTPPHRCDVRFGRDVVDVLARCAAALRD